MVIDVRQNPRKILGHYLTQRFNSYELIVVSNRALTFFLSRMAARLAP